jgi:hypothetical protein
MSIDIFPGTNPYAIPATTLQAIKCASDSLKLKPGLPTWSMSEGGGGGGRGRGREGGGGE